MTKYTVRWKGKELGGFTKQEIEDSLRSSKMGFLHQVLMGKDWVGLRFFLDNYKEEVPTIKLNPKLISFAYFSTGLAFLSPYLIIISMCFAIYLHTNNAKKNALFVFLFALATMSLGIVFFEIIRHIRA